MSKNEIIVLTDVSDNDFWDRASTMRLWPYGYLPMIHLWHAPQERKFPIVESPGVQRYRELRKTPPEERIRALRKRRRGGPESALRP